MEGPLPEKEQEVLDALVEELDARPGVVRLLEVEPTPEERYSHAARLMAMGGSS